MYAIPTGILLGIPIIQKQILVLDAESQLVGCFAAFVITAYTQGGGENKNKQQDERERAEAVVVL